MNPRELKHRFRMILAGIRYSLLSGHDDNDVPTLASTVSALGPKTSASSSSSHADDKDDKHLDP